MVKVLFVVLCLRLVLSSKFRVLSAPLQRQQILTMLYVDELPPEEIARILHCSVDNIYKTKRRTLNSLRKMLDELEGTK